VVVAVALSLANFDRRLIGTMARLQLLWHQADRAALPSEETRVGPPEASPTVAAAVLFLEDSWVVPMAPRASSPVAFALGAPHRSCESCSSRSRHPPSVGESQTSSTPPRWSRHSAPPPAPAMQCKYPGCMHKTSAAPRPFGTWYCRPN